MAEKIVTIKDIASNLGVSPTTVHKALYNKEGIGGKRRKEILDYVEKNNFKLNKAASALKRRPIRLAVLLIEPVEDSRFFYADVLKGVDEAMNDLEPFNVELVRYYSALDADSQNEVMEVILREQSDSMDGLLLTPAHETKINGNIKRLTEKGIKVVTVNSDTKESSRHACVANDTTMSGRLAAELMCALGISDNRQVLLLGGHRDITSHQRLEMGFFRLMQEEAPQVGILELHNEQDAGNFEWRLRKFLGSFDDIAGIYCITGRSTLIMCKVVFEMGLSGRLSVIGSDIFPELIPFFENRTLTASIFQNPTQQGYRGLQSLYQLVTGEVPVPELFDISSGIALRNNARSFLNHT